MSSDQVLFRLYQIATEQYAAITEVDVVHDTVEINAGVEFGIDRKNSRLACKTAFQFQSEDKNFLVLHVRCEFEIQEEAWTKFHEPEEKRFVFPAHFLQHLGVITVGTARGVLHAKTDGTKFNQYFLPTINLSEMISDPVSFDEQEQ